MKSQNKNFTTAGLLISIALTVHIFRYILLSSIFASPTNIHTYIYWMGLAVLACSALIKSGLHQLRDVLLYIGCGLLVLVDIMDLIEISSIHFYDSVEQVLLILSYVGEFVAYIALLLSRFIPSIGITATVSIGMAFPLLVNIYYFASAVEMSGYSVFSFYGIYRIMHTFVFLPLLMVGFTIYADAFRRKKQASTRMINAEYRLRQLNSMYQSGMITPEQYAWEKANILRTL